MAAAWYLARGTGIVLLVLLGLVVALGVATRSGRALPGLPRFVLTMLHRSTSLLVLALLTVHVTTMVLDPYAGIGVLDVVVPFRAAAHPLAYGAGTLALDLLLAVTATSLLRRHIGPRVWRAVHWIAYACWPLSVAHGLGGGTDAGRPWMLGAVALSAALVLGSVGWRLTFPPGPGVSPAAPWPASADDRRRSGSAPLFGSAELPVRGGRR